MPRIDFSTGEHFGQEWAIIDLDTGRDLGMDITWADEETGEYEVLLRDASGQHYVDPASDDVARDVRKARLLIVPPGDTVPMFATE